MVLFGALQFYAPYFEHGLMYFLVHWIKEYTGFYLYQEQKVLNLICMMGQAFRVLKQLVNFSKGKNGMQKKMQKKRIIAKSTFRFEVTICFNC